MLHSDCQSQFKDKLPKSGFVRDGTSDIPTWNLGRQNFKDTTCL